MTSSCQRDRGGQAATTAIRLPSPRRDDRSHQLHSRVGRSRRNERHVPMTVRLRPLIKPDGRISRIRLSEPLHRRVFGLNLGFAVERVLEFPKLLWDSYLLRAIPRSCTPLPRVRTSSVPWRQSRATVLTMNASDFQTNARRLTGRTGLRGRLGFGLSLTHRPGPPLRRIAIFDGERLEVIDGWGVTKGGAC